MQREILYRGKKLYDGSWEYGFLSWSDTPRGRSYFVNNNIVEPETVCQFTGIDDREGNKIFEDDIFKIGAEEGVFTVKFDYGCFLAYDYNGEQVGILSELSTMFIKLIGNIHDNKELLK